MPSQESRPDQADQPGEAGRPAKPSRPVGTVRPTLRPLVEALRAIEWREPRTAWRQLVALVGLPKLIIGGALVVLMLAAFVLPGGERADPFEGPGGALDLLIKLGAVVVLAYVMMAALKRYTAGSASQRGALLDVLDSKSLGPNRSVYVVRAGGKRLVLGVTQHQITALAELDVEQPAVLSQPEADFAAHLQHELSTQPQDDLIP
jgi:flagellar biosynthetic protein FliO